MGQRMPDEPIEYGDDCLLGWAAGETPKYLYVRFINIIPCPGGPELPPNDRVFKLTQDPVLPCGFFYLEPPWEIEFVVLEDPLQIWFVLYETTSGDIYFIDTPLGAPDEKHTYENLNAACTPDIGGAGGIAAVTWIPQVTTLLEAINLVKSDDLFMELFPLENNQFVYKFCRIRESTNIKILYEPD